MAINIDEMANFCKRRGFVYQNSEIYGGMAGFFDYGPVGVEVKNNIKQDWWKFHVQAREDVAGIDGSIIAHPKVWEASGHVGCFADQMFICSNAKCKNKLRADTYVEEVLNIPSDGMTAEQLNDIAKNNSLKCPKCDSEFKEIEDFNLMFSTTVGPKMDEDNKAYLRPETAQLIFTDFKLVQENARLKLPFGIAQVGKAFRNEISPRHFLFRCREFEQMEIEYFIHPDKSGECPYIADVMDYKLKVYSADMQNKKQKEKEMTMKTALSKKIIKTPWHAYWLAMEHKWFTGLGANPDNFRIRQHLDTEKSHYALDTWDLEYNFPWGWKELEGMANRTDFDLQQHIKHSKENLSLFDEESKEKVVPHVVAEPSLGVDRAFLVFMFDAYEEKDDPKTGKTVVMHLHPKLAPVKVAIFPLVNKFDESARKVYDDLKDEFVCAYDKGGSIGKRYARNDEIGTPYGVTMDNEKGDTATIRDRDSTKQVRVKTKELKDVLRQLLAGEIEFEKAGEIVK